MRHINLPIKTLIVFLGLIFFASPKISLAKELTLLINEIYSNPINQEDVLESDPDRINKTREWIELFNPTDQPVDLASCAIEDATNKPQSLDKFTQILPNEHLVIYGGKNDFSFGLNNDKETLILKCNQNDLEQEYDRVSYGDSNNLGNARVPSMGQSITRIDGQDNTGVNLNDFVIAAPTPGKPYLIPLPKEYSHDVILSELLPSPDNGSDNEFVEIFNSGKNVIDLSGWKIDDEEGSSSSYLIPEGTQISPGEYIALFHSTTKIYFNDDADSVRLLFPDGKIAEEIDYKSPQKGSSLAVFDCDWKWTFAPTPGAMNFFKADEASANIFKDDQPENSTIAEARQTPIGNSVIVKGVVTAPPDSLSSQYFYIQDENSGIQVYSYDKDFPLLQSGDNIQVEGVLSESNGERRIKIESKHFIFIIGKINVPVPKEVGLVDVNESNEGNYIQATGEVINPSGDQFYLSSGTKLVQVLIKDQETVQKPRIKSGDKVKVSGIASRYRDHYRLLPFMLGDVKIISGNTEMKAMLPEAGSSTCHYLIIIFNLIISWTIYQKVSKKRTRLPKKSLKMLRVVIFFYFMEISGAGRRHSLVVLPGLWV